MKLAGDRPSDRACSGDGDAHQSDSGPLLQGELDVVGVLLAHHEVEDVAVLEDGVRVGQHTLPEPVDPGDPGVGESWNRLVCSPTQVGADRSGVHADGARRVAEVGLAVGGEDPAQHLVRGPLDGGNGGDAQPLVDLGASGVVDARHDVLDPEGLPGDAGGDDVGVVAAGYREEGVGAVGAGLVEHLLVEAHPGHPDPGEGRAEPAERIGVAVDHGHGVAALLEAAGKQGPDAAAAHDHDVHGSDATRPRRGPRRAPGGLAFRAWE